MIHCTSEYFTSCGLTIWQPAKGHRYGPESLALADFVRAGEGVRIAELGSGVGVIALLIASRTKGAAVYAVEIQDSLHAIAVRNVKGNGYERSVTCVNDDYRRFAAENRNAFDLVVSNPPFYAAGPGRMSPNSQRAQARHEINGTVADVVKAARDLLVSGGKFAVVFARRRVGELRRAAVDAGLEENRIEEPESGSFLLLEFQKN